MHLLDPDQMVGFTRRSGENCQISGRYLWARPQEAARNARLFESYKWSMAKVIQRAGVGTGPNFRRGDYARRGALDLIEEYFLSPCYDLKYLRFADGSEVLFDLANDPSEITNVAQEPAYDVTIEKLRTQLVQMRERPG